jgi:ERCC4-related helicase
LRIITNAVPSFTFAHPPERLLSPRPHPKAVYVEHPLIRPGLVEARAYQVNVARSCIERSTLVVLPTGMGKTIVALLVIADVLEKERGKVLLMAPTKPLVEQHAAFIRRMTTVEDVVVFTGETPPEDRELEWRENRVIVSTPQVVRNDIRKGRYDLLDMALIVYDEAHRAVGNYAYVHVAAAQEPLRTLSLGMTASPGTKGDDILEICDTLHIEAVEIRSPEDVDVRPYMHDINVQRVFVNVPPHMAPVIEDLRRLMRHATSKLTALGLVRRSDQVTMKELLAAQKRISAQLSAQAKPPPQLYHAATAAAQAMKVGHALELAETQGAKVLVSYLDRLETEADRKGASRADKGLVNDPVFQRMAKRVRAVTEDHPKAEALEAIIRQQFSGKPDSRVIVFCHYRDNAELVSQRLSSMEGVHPVRFVGQATKGEDRGLTQKEQVGLIEDFKKGVYNVLVATSVAEEGLDIPSTELVVFYEPIPSEIRTIQRRGRTGRARAGEVRILVTRGTRDEAYTYSAKSKEDKMHRELDRLRKRLKGHIQVGEPALQPGFLDGEAVGGDLGLGSDDAQHSLLDFDGGAPREKEVSVEVSPPVEEPEEGVQVEDDDIEASLEPPETVGRPDPEALELAGVIHVAAREADGWLAGHLKEMGVITRRGPDGVADYRLSQWVGVRRLRSDEFRRMLDDNTVIQLARDLKEAFPKPVIVVEGGPLAPEGREEARRVWGAIASIQSDWEVAVISTRDATQTADVLVALLLREAVMAKQGS